MSARRIKEAPSGRTHISQETPLALHGHCYQHRQNRLSGLPAYACDDDDSERVGTDANQDREEFGRKPLSCAVSAFPKELRAKKRWGSPSGCNGGCVAKATAATTEVAGSGPPIERRREPGSGREVGYVCYRTS